MLCELVRAAAWIPCCTREVVPSLPQPNLSASALALVFLSFRKHLHGKKSFFDFFGLLSVLYYTFNILFNLLVSVKKI